MNPIFPIDAYSIHFFTSSTLFSFCFFFLFRSIEWPLKPDAIRFANNRNGILNFYAFFCSKKLIHLICSPFFRFDNSKVDKMRKNPFGFKIEKALHRKSLSAAVGWLHSICKLLIYCRHQKPLLFLSSQMGIVQPNIVVRLYSVFNVHFVE